ncbi:Uncharacterised protein [Oligella urethralis]|uniref:hypothetical protein n=1 Tax=Oligella urethralis TaxID=90245 RepID=UPI000E035358|nr:hypothetical protein [Oligella urethralis]SUA63243.1 Uncharacterised protein [Oligella urethralis]
MSKSKYINTEQIHPVLGVFLAGSCYSYDFSNPEPNEISVTSLIKPVKRTLLSQRVPMDLAKADLLGNVQRSIGTAIHNEIESSWKNSHKEALADLGYPESIINRFLINPKPEELTPASIPVYIENRSRKENVYKDYVVTGKYDFIFNGVVVDIKTTSTYSYMADSSSNDYILQGSMYRWLNPEKITEDYMTIAYIFTDYSQTRANTNPDYPQQRIATRDFHLMTYQETERWIKERLFLLDSLKNSPEADMPDCTDEELWRTETVYKYYKDPSKTTRSTRNFTSKQEAMVYMATKGNGKGIILDVPGEVRACKYCPAFPICEQKDSLIASGDLVL